MLRTHSNPFTPVAKHPPNQIPSASSVTAVGKRGTTEGEYLACDTGTIDRHPVGDDWQAAQLCLSFPPSPYGRTDLVTFSTKEQALLHLPHEHKNPEAHALRPPLKRPRVCQPTPARSTNIARTGARANTGRSPVIVCVPNCARS